MPKAAARQYTRAISESCPSQAGIVPAADGAPVLTRVKICGLDSANRRRYTPEALTAARALYSGVKVNIDHTANPHASRSYRDRFGMLENITSEEDGLFGDLRFNPEHGEAKSVLWFAANMPDALGLSHNAVGQGHDEHGVFVVEKILSVRSVDLVADPATTRGLREDKHVMPMTTLGKFFESAKWTAAKANRVKTRIAALYESGVLNPLLEMEGCDPEGATPDHEEALKQGFRASCVAVLDDDTMDAKAKVARLKELLGAHEKLSADKEDDESGDDAGEGDDEPMTTEGKKTKAAADTDEVKTLREANAAYAKRLDTLESANRVSVQRRLAESLMDELKLPKLARSDLFTGQLIECKDAKEMKALIEDRRKIAGIQKPTSSAGGSGPVGAAATMTKDDFKRQLLKR